MNSNFLYLSLSHGERGDREAVGEGLQASHLQSFGALWNPSSALRAPSPHGRRKITGASL